MSGSYEDPPEMSTLSQVIDHEHMIKITSNFTRLGGKYFLITLTFWIICGAFYKIQNLINFKLCQVKTKFKTSCKCFFFYFSVNLIIRKIFLFIN